MAVIFKPKKKEILDGRSQIFKKSPNSICHNCLYLKNFCNTANLVMIAETDKKIKLAYVSKCNGYEAKSQ